MTIKNILSEKNIRTNKNRVAILESIIKKKCCISINDIYSEVKKDLKIDLATIYRNINLFLEKGIINEVKNPEDKRSYVVYSENSHDHPHFICEDCQKMICLKGFDKKCFDIISHYCVEEKINEIQIFIKGLCKVCANK